MFWVDRRWKWSTVAFTKPVTVIWESRYLLRYPGDTLVLEMTNVTSLRVIAYYHHHHQIGGGSSSYSNREYDIQARPVFMGVGTIRMNIVSKQIFPGCVTSAVLGMSNGWIARPDSL